MIAILTVDIYLFFSLGQRDVRDHFLSSECTFLDKEKGKKKIEAITDDDGLLINGDYRSLWILYSKSHRIPADFLFPRLTTILYSICKTGLLFITYKSLCTKVSIYL